MAILRHLDPDELHIFEALYSDSGPLIAWARRHPAAGTGALRVLFRPGEPTAANSLRVDAGLDRPPPRFRAEETGISHVAIPRTYGSQLLASSAANLPGTARPQGHRRARGSAADLPCGPSLGAARDDEPAKPVGW
jgi:hypothetical protein